MTNQTTIIETFSHHFVVRFPTPAIIPALYSLSSQYTQFGMKFDPRSKKKRWAPLKTFAIYVERGVEFRFHINQFNDFITELNRRYVDKSSYEIIEHPDYEPVVVDIPTREGWVPRNAEQSSAVDFVIIDNSRENNSTLLMLPTGFGKGFIALAATSKRSYCFAVICLAGYVEKWTKEIVQILDIEPSEVAVIQGSDSLIRCTNYPDSGLPIPKAFVISLSTLNNWYKLYEEARWHPSLEAYACRPGEFFESLGIGTVIFDEAHQHPHAVFRAYAYLHVPKVINLTATMLTEDQSLQKVQRMMFPRTKRFDSVKMEKYITSHACVYQVSNFAQSRLRTAEYGMNSYSHNAYEKSILHNKVVRPQYLKMIMDLIQTTYIDDYIEKDKVAIYVGTVNMAKEILEAVKKKWPHLDSRLFLEGSPLKDVLEPDIILTTVVKAGVALDIPNLRRVIMTISAKSGNLNAQLLGRLRNLKDRDVHFYYMYCSTIPKHVEYHENKKDLFNDRCKDQRQQFLSTIYV